MSVLLVVVYSKILGRLSVSKWLTGSAAAILRSRTSRVQEVRFRVNGLGSRICPETQLRLSVPAKEAGSAVPMRISLISQVQMLHILSERALRIARSPSNRSNSFLEIP